MAAQAQGFVLGVYHDFVVRHMLGDILGHMVTLEAYVDSKILLNVFGKECTKTEQRLQIGIFLCDKATKKWNFPSLDISRDPKRSLTI